MRKIKDILQENPDMEYEVYHSPRRIHRLTDNTFVYAPFCGFASGYREDIDIQVLWAVDYCVVTKEEYESTVADLGGMSVDDYFQGQDEILVIWLSHHSMKILENESIKKVRDVLTENLGQYGDYIVLKPQRNSNYNDSHRHDYDDIDNDEMYSDSVDHAEEYEEVSGYLDRIKKMYAEDCVLVDEKDFLRRYKISTSRKDPWWEEESFFEHFGREGVKILLIFLA